MGVDAQGGPRPATSWLHLQRRRMVLFGGDGATGRKLGHGAGFAVLQVGLNRGDDDVLPVSRQVDTQQMQAAGGVDHDTFVEHAIEQVDQFHARRLASRTQYWAATSQDRKCRVSSGVRASRPPKATQSVNQ